MWAFFHFGHSPISIGYALFISMVTYCIGRVLFAKFLLDFQILQWAKQVLFPIVLLVVVSSLAGYLVMSAFEPSLLRLVLTSILTGIVTSVIGWLSVFNRSERVYVWSGIQQKLFKRTGSIVG
jgi:hypothetical protein